MYRQKNDCDNDLKMCIEFTFSFFGSKFTLIFYYNVDNQSNSIKNCKKKLKQKLLFKNKTFFTKVHKKKIKTKIKTLKSSF